MNRAITSIDYALRGVIILRYASSTRNAAGSFLLLSDECSETQMYYAGKIRARI